MKPFSRRRLLAGSSAALLGYTLPRLAAPAFALDDDRQGRIRDLAESFLSEIDAPGISIAFGRDGELVYADAFGVDWSAADRPLTTERRFRIASISKPITAAAIMQLADAGSLDVDASVFGPDSVLGERFPLASAAPKAELLGQLTVSHLLTHSAGGWGNKTSDPMFMDPSLALEDLINLTLASQPLEHEPGTHHAYSNFGYALLGQVIEAVTGKDYADHVREALLEPCGATGMAIGGSTEDERLEGEVFYRSTEGDGEPYRMNLPRMDANGGWVGTPTDLVRFALAVDGDASADDLISAEAVERMARPVEASPFFGHGWQINPKHGNRWHTGSLPGTTALLVLVEGGACFAGIVNRRRKGEPDSGAELDKLMWKIYREVMA